MVGKLVNVHNRPPASENQGKSIAPLAFGEDLGRFGEESGHTPASHPQDRRQVVIGTETVNSLESDNA